MALKLEYILSPVEAEKKLQKLLVQESEKRMRKIADAEAFYDGFRTGIYKALDELIKAELPPKEDEA